MIIANESINATTARLITIEVRVNDCGVGRTIQSSGALVKIGATAFYL
jgi:hypothetical protein